MTVTVVRPGAPKAAPFTIAIMANPAIESPWGSGNVVADPIVADVATFDASVAYIESALFGELPNQAEPLLGVTPIRDQIRLVAVFDAQCPVDLDHALVAEETQDFLLVPRAERFGPLLSTYGIAVDVGFAVSGSPTHTRASSWYTHDDDTKPGVPFTLNGRILHHRYWPAAPGTIALHQSSTSMTAAHEFLHAVSSYTNGAITDLYVDWSDEATTIVLNNRRGRPIPGTFARYAEEPYETDPDRMPLGYPADWSSYHCQRIDRTVPALMDDYWQATPPETCQNDLVTRRFVLDRLRAKLAR